MSIELIAKSQHQLTETAQWILDNCIIIDTETTGLGDDDTVLEIAAIRASDGDVIVNHKIEPLSLGKPAAMAINKLDWDDLVLSGHNFGKVYGILLNESDDFNLQITAFNRAFDERLCRQTAFKTDPTLTRRWPTPEKNTCIMELANRAFAHHLEWDAEQAKFKRLSLAKCLQIAGIEFDGEPHRALTDAKATLELVKYIANGGR